MSPPEFDPIAQLAVLNRHGVRYVVLGGFAAVAYGSPLPTTDVDLTPAPDPDNLRRLSAALTELSAQVRVEGLPGGLPFSHSAESLREVTVLNLVTDRGELDLVMVPAGDAGYRELASRQLLVRLGEMEVPLAALSDVIASKEAAGRPKDRAALPVLRRLAERLAERDDR